MDYVQRAFRPPSQPYNEPVLDYAPGSTERAAVKAKLAELKSAPIEVPLVIGGREVKTGNTAPLRAPHDHTLDLGVYHKAGEAEVRMAIDAALEARVAWSEMPWEQRASVIMKAADLLAGPWRQTVNAATMLGQSKTVFQAEIDSACELIDFWRFNVSYLAQLMSDQPASSPGVWNRLEYRALEGFVFAVTPFNFTAIGGNLPTAPALTGCTVLWKPASSAVYSAWHVMGLLREAGLPPGVINFIPGSGAEVGDPVLDSPDLAGIHFTGIDGYVPADVPHRGREPGAHEALSPDRGRDGRQGFHLRPRLGGRGSPGLGGGPRRLRISGAEVFRGLPDVRAPLPVAGLQGPVHGGGFADQDGGSGGLHELHGGRDRRGVLREHFRIHRIRAVGGRRRDHHRRRLRPGSGLVRRAHGHRHDEPAVPDHGGRDLRPRADDIRLRG